ncbi:MAG TPA: hypothetical protein PLB25_21280 [Rhodoferax sp.]|nr:hypothetical protein [Rhodoferax sp.]
MTKRPQSLSEEIGNSISHAAAIAAAIASVPFLMASTYRKFNRTRASMARVFGSQAIVTRSV